MPLYRALRHIAALWRRHDVAAALPGTLPHSWCVPQHFGSGSWSLDHTLLHRACGCASNINPLHWLLVSTCSQVPRPRLRTLNGVDADVNLQCRRASCVRASSSVAFIPAQELQRALAWQPCYMTGMLVLGQVRPTYGRHWSDVVTAS